MAVDGNGNYSHDCGSCLKCNVERPRDVLTLNLIVKKEMAGSDIRIRARYAKADYMLISRFPMVFAARVDFNVPRAATCIIFGRVLYK